MTHITRRVFAAISRRQTLPHIVRFRSEFWLKLSDFCNARYNKADIKINTQHSDILGASTKPTQNKTKCIQGKITKPTQNKTKCIQGKITKPTQNQVYSSQNHKTNSESRHIQANISITFLTKKSRYQKQYPSRIRIGKITINTSLKFITNNLTL